MARNKRLPKSPPCGVITAMFTDIVNSTKLKGLMEDDTAARRDARFRSDIKEPHDKIVLTCMEKANGHKVKSTGDGYLFTFTDAEEAVLCALQIQEQLRANPIKTPCGPLQVRIGLHTGIASPTGDDYSASAIDKAARVESKAESGQVFISRETHTLVIGKVRGVDFEKMGTFDLKGLESEDLYRAFRTGVKTSDTDTLRIGAHDAPHDPDTHVALASGDKESPLTIPVDQGAHLAQLESPVIALLRYEPRQDGLYVINRWSPARLLTRDRLSIVISSTHPDQKWFQQKEWWDEVATQSAKSAGDICYLIDYEIDHRESHLGDKFCMTIAPCSYAEHLATCELLNQHPEIRDQIAQLIQTDPREYARQACPSSIAINIVVLSSTNSFLAILRSTAVHDAKGVWTVGPCETMTLSPHTPGRREDLFDLAERCLWEEIGLEPHHYGEVVVSWIGFYLPLARGHVVAQVKLAIPEEEALNLAAGAHSIFEAERFEWIPFNKENISKYIAGREGPLADRTWIDQARLAFQETWRMRSVLHLV